MQDCIFCKIVSGEASCHKIWEDELHLAFLSIFRILKVFSGDHQRTLPSYAFDLPENVLIELVKAAKQTAKLLDAKLENVGRTGMIFEDLAWIIFTRNYFQCMAQKSRSGNSINPAWINILKSTKDIFRRMIISAPMTASSPLLPRRLKVDKLFATVNL